MGTISKSGFAWSVQDAAGVLYHTGREAEHVLAYAWQVNTTAAPVRAEFGQLRGKQTILVGIASLIRCVLINGKPELIFSSGDALRGIHTKPHWMALTEFNRIQERAKKILGIFPPFVQYYLCGSTRPDEIAKAQDWLYRFFTGLSQLPEAQAAKKEASRLAALLHVEQQQQAA